MLKVFTVALDNLLAWLLRLQGAGGLHDDCVISFSQEPLL